MAPEEGHTCGLGLRDSWFIIIEDVALSETCAGHEDGVH